MEDARLKTSICALNSKPETLYIFPDHGFNKENKKVILFKHKKKRVLGVKAAQERSLYFTVCDAFALLCLLITT